MARTQSPLSAIADAGTRVATNKTRGTLGMLFMLASMLWLQFNPLSLMNANKGVVGVNLRHMWDESTA
jgi:hypothetical protein